MDRMQQKWPMDNDYKLQKAQEEAFAKSNLDYENRLRGHMFQFEDGVENMVQAIPPGSGMQMI